MPENNTEEGASVDCEHLALEAETVDMNYSRTIVLHHTLRCVVCGLSVRMVRRVARVETS